ncbi:GNAT family N-acetyltransferase [Parasphingorhabdus sp.]|uniref:GNAT family N-acetyltransferase n=1 Tax=Parasphingorhabdus sp. TaxID=2709688 RepID=UPI003263520A
MSILPDGYRLSERQQDMQPVAIHAYLTSSYWAKGIPLDIVEKSIKGSLCVGVFHEDDQISFARLVTDMATFAYLADVYVLAGHGKQGVAKAMVQYLQDHQELTQIRNWLLMTADAQSLYSSLGWQQVADPRKTMQRSFPDIYQ